VEETNSVFVGLNRVLSVPVRKAPPGVGPKVQSQLVGSTLLESYGESKGNLKVLGITAPLTNFHWVQYTGFCTFAEQAPPPPPPQE
jgi:hypothetical protein